MAAGEEFLILTEIQSAYDPRMPRRMQAYAALAEEALQPSGLQGHHDIAAPPPGTTIATRYESTFRGLCAAAITTSSISGRWTPKPPSNRPSSLSFRSCPCFAEADNQQMVRCSSAALHQLENAQDFEPLLGYFTRIALGAETAAQIARFDMVVIEQSEWYREFCQDTESSEA